MKLQKNKIVFVLVLVCVVLFITVYALLTFGKEQEPELNTDQIPLPDLGESPKAYESKLEALEAIKEERETTAPPLYPERMVDDKGYFNPDYMEYEKQRIIDSVYSSGKLNVQRERIGGWEETPTIEPKTEPTLIEDPMPENPITIKESALEHQLFFASDPMVRPLQVNGTADVQILVRVDGTQTVRQGYRLSMRSEEDAIINGKRIPRNTSIYGFVGFRPNRAMITIDKIDHNPVSLAAYDLQDGDEGIYIVNSFRAEAGKEVVGDAIGDINIGGLPQVRGIKALFQRDNRRIKVTVSDNYQLVLKIPKGQ